MPLPRSRHSAIMVRSRWASQNSSAAEHCQKLLRVVEILLKLNGAVDTPEQPKTCKTIIVLHPPQGLVRRQERSSLGTHDGSAGRGVTNTSSDTDRRAPHVDKL